MHEDVWALTLELATSSDDRSLFGPDVLRWAAEVMDARFSVKLTPWRMGPSTGEEGVSVLYADLIGDLVVKDRSELIKKALFGLH
jgi:hypothetical protein